METAHPGCQDRQERNRNIQQISIKFLKIGRLSSLNKVVKKSICLTGALSAVLLSLLNPVLPAAADPSKKSFFTLFPGKKLAQNFRHADAAPSRDRAVLPPMEMQYFPVNPDGTPIVLDIDTTVNFTDALNRFYYDPKWRGEVWVPFNQWSISERATRLMSTWPEYDEFSIYRKLNHVHKFFERYSGFGP